MPYVGRVPSAVPVTADDIPANSIDASKIVDGSIELAEIADNSITDAKLNSSKLDGIETGATNYIHPTTHATADIADNAITEAKIADAAVVSLKSGRKNLIINGDFQVSQRGDYTTATTASGSTYYLDRFKTVLGGAFTYTHKISQLVDGKYVNTLLQTMTATGYSATQQFVEDFAKLKGQTVTLSVWVKSNKAGANINIYDGVSQTHSSSHTGGGGWEKLTVSHNCSTSTTLMRAEIWTSTGAVVGSFIEFTNFQLELGSVATDFEHRSYGEELALCKRYYHKATTGTSTESVGSGTPYQAGSGLYVPWRFPIEMRVAPTLLSSTGVSDFRARNGNSITFAGFVGSNGPLTRMGGTLITATVTGSTVGTMHWIETNVAAASLAFDAEL